MSSENLSVILVTAKNIQDTFQTSDSFAVQNSGQRNFIVTFTPQEQPALDHIIKECRREGHYQDIQQPQELLHSDNRTGRRIVLNELSVLSVVDINEQTTEIHPMQPGHYYAIRLTPYSGVSSLSSSLIPHTNVFPVDAIVYLASAGGPHIGSFLAQQKPQDSLYRIDPSMQNFFLILILMSNKFC